MSENVKYVSEITIIIIVNLVLNVITVTRTSSILCNKNMPKNVIFDSNAEQYLVTHFHPFHLIEYLLCC